MLATRLNKLKVASSPQSRLNHQSRVLSAKSLQHGAEGAEEEGGQEDNGLGDEGVWWLWDLDKQDAIHIVDQLGTTYGTCEEVLTTTVKALKDRLDILDPTWAYRRAPVATTVPHPPAAGVTETIRLSPVHFWATRRHIRTRAGPR